MNKTIGGICLIASTAIGSGMLALPLILASLGIFYSIALVFAVWALTYYASLVNIELNLQAGKGTALGRLGRMYSGRIAELIGVLSIKIISYTLLSVFIYGISSVIQNMLVNLHVANLSFELVAILSTIVSVAVLALSMQLIDHINRVLFYGLLTAIGAIIFGLLIVIDWSNLPINEQVVTFTELRLAVPVLFTSFGYQTIFASLVQYCQNDKRRLKIACFYGSLIPVIVYILWFVVILVVIYNHDPGFYTLMITGKTDVAAMILTLSQIANITYMQSIIWCLSVLAIFTSLIGLGMGLTSAWEDILTKHHIRETTIIVKLQSLSLSFIPSLFIALVVQNAFIRMLSFTGMILVIIAVLLPLYLLYKIKNRKLHYEILTSGFIRLIAAISGTAIILMEIINIFLRDLR